MSAKTRIKQLEKQSGKGEKKKYFCLLKGDAPYLPDGRYKVQSAFGGEDLYIDTLAELEAFGKRADIELTTICVLYASEELGSDVQEDSTAKDKNQ